MRDLLSSSGDPSLPALPVSGTLAWEVSRNIMVTVDQARALALSMPQAEEKSHHNHPDFRVCDKIFATLWLDGIHSVLKLDPGERMTLMMERPEVFSVPRGGERYGWTIIRITQIEEDELRYLMMKSWRETAPKRLVAEHDARRGSAPTERPPTARSPRRKGRKP